MNKMYTRKPFIVLAHQLDESVTLNTISGPVIGHRGDYLITYRNGMQNICDRETFKQKYEQYKPVKNIKKRFYCISSEHESNGDQ